MESPDGTQISSRRPSIFCQKTAPDFGPESGPDFGTEKWTTPAPNVGKTMSTSNDETAEDPNVCPDSGPENGTANLQKITEFGPTILQCGRVENAGCERLTFRKGIASQPHGDQAAGLEEPTLARPPGKILWVKPSPKRPTTWHCLACKKNHASCGQSDPR